MTINPNDKLTKLANKIINEDVTVTTKWQELEGKKISKVLAITYNYHPAYIFITEDKYVFFSAITTDFDMLDNEEIDIRRAFVSKESLKAYVIYDNNKFRNNLKTLSEAGIVNIDNLNAYITYRDEQAKKDKEEYQKKMEYEKYLKLKEKFEENA